MTEKEKQILETFGKVIPYLSEMEKEKLLAFGEGLGFAVSPNNLFDWERPHESAS